MELTIKLRRDSAYNWRTINPILAEGEAGVELNTRKIKIGDGTRHWNDLPYSTVIPQTDITPGTHTKITYDQQGLVTAGEDIVLADVTDITATAAEVNVLDGITASTDELNILDGVTASTEEINILDGATVNTTELNYLAGVTSSVQGQIGDLSTLSTEDKTNLVDAVNEVIESTDANAGTAINNHGNVLELKNAKGEVLSSVARTFIFEQGIPAAEWNIVHNLDKFPSISVVDSSGNIVEVSRKYIDRNTVVLKMNSAFSGKAYLN